ncbi:hypothetical protein B0H19DRAFT_1057175 [Mycena capillaripes]|nr:hypothetical protein B0H19DRAFT_1057175 [Mycena capillaripes]
MKTCGGALCTVAFCISRYFARAATPGSRSTGAASAIATPAFQFNKIPDMTTCKPTVVTWIYAPVTVDDQLVLTLAITNHDVPQSAPLSGTSTGAPATHMGASCVSSLSGRDEAASHNITHSPLDPAFPSFTWQSVNVTEGWYAILATMNLPGFLSRSTSFFVENGTDTSCLRTESALRSSSTGGGASTTRINTSKPTDLAPSLAGTNGGAIAGGVIGGIVVVLGAVVLIMHCRSRRVAASANTTSTTAHPAIDRPTSRSPRTTETALVLDRPIALAAIESQEAMFIKFARMQEEMRARERQASDENEETFNGLARTEQDNPRFLPVSSEVLQDVPHAVESGEPGPAESELLDLDLEQMSTPDLARQLRTMALRVALMEARMQSHGISDERPPDYSVQL